MTAGVEMICKMLKKNPKCSEAHSFHPTLHHTRDYEIKWMYVVCTQKLLEESR